MSTPPLQTQKKQPAPLRSENAAPEIDNNIVQVEPRAKKVSENVPENKEQKDNDERSKFKKILGDDVVRQGFKIVENTIVGITKSKAYFRREDVVRRALARAQKEVEEEFLELKEFEQYIRWLVSNRSFKDVGKTNYVTTHEMWRDEELIIRLAGVKDPVFKQPEDVVERAIARKEGISKEQSDAVEAAALSENAVTVIEGTAGAGKSFTMEAVKEIYMEQGYHVMGTALGWAAAKVLGESAKLEDENCKAIEGLTRQWLAARQNGTDPFQGPTLLIVDEAGMVGTKHMAIILEETSRSMYPVKVVLTGDSLQVVPVAAGNALEAIIKKHGTTRINTIRRQHQFTHRRSVMNFSKKLSGTAINTFLQQEAVHWCKDSDMMLNMVVRNYVSYRLAYPKKKALVITLSNKEVLELNFRIRAAYKKLGLIGAEDVRLTVNNGIETFETDFSEGDEVLLRANDKNLIVYETDETKSLAEPDTWKPIRMGVFNRNAGRIVHIRRSKDPIGSYDFVIDLAGDTPGRVIVNSDKFRSPELQGMPMLHNYAGTIYGSQGQTVSQVFLIDSARMDFRLAYVGASRHKENLDIYLNETELHRRLDNVVGKRQSLESRLKMEKQGKSLDDATVELGRYTRSAMLRAVALAWGKHSENLTATVFENMRRTEFLTNNAEAQKAADVGPAEFKELVVDFIPEYNVRYPLVDVEKILELPDPVQESELIRASDTEENRKRYGVQEMPIDEEHTPVPMDPRAAPRRENAGALPTRRPPNDDYFTKAFGWLLSEKKSTPEPQTPQAPKPSLRQADPVSAFEGVEGVDARVEDTKAKPEKSLFKKSITYLNRWLNPSPKVEIPYLKGSQPCGKIEFPEFDKEIDTKHRWEGIVDSRPHYLSFEGVPTPANVTGGPDREWLAAQKDKLWSVGRFGEPRVLALSPQGEVVARYRMNGECVVGEGQAPIIVNRNTDENGKPNKQVYIVAGAKEWLWLRESMEKSNQDDLSKMPHIIWGAKDVDWNLIAPSLNIMSRIVIVRSKADDRQIPWALSLQKILLERHNVQTVISPAIPENTPSHILNPIADENEKVPAPKM